TEDVLHPRAGLRERGEHALRPGHARDRRDARATERGERLFAPASVGGHAHERRRHEPPAEERDAGRRIPGALEREERPRAGSRSGPAGSGQARAVSSLTSTRSASRASARCWKPSSSTSASSAKRAQATAAASARRSPLTTGPAKRRASSTASSPPSSGP